MSYVERLPKYELRIIADMTNIKLEKNIKKI